MENLNAFLQDLGINTKNIKLFEQVFTHRSYLNEHKSLNIEHNERLEFLGDAVLELVVTEHLYNAFDKPEGEMTSWRSALVKGESLSAESKRLNFEQFLRVSRGESKNTGKARDLILANTFEAFIGAVYLDLGYQTAYEFIEKNIIYKLQDIITNADHIDSKSRLQEIVQEKLSITPSYETIDEIGPDHDKKFVVAVFFGDKKIAEGTGNSKQRAQIDAAAKALEDHDLFN